MPSCTEALRYQYTRARRKTVAQRIEQERYRTCSTDCRQSLVTEITSDYHRVHYIIKLLEQISRKQRQSEQKYVPELTALCHISYIFIHIYCTVSFYSGITRRHRDYNPFL